MQTPLIYFKVVPPFRSYLKLSTLKENCLVVLIFNSMPRLSFFLHTKTPSGVHSKSLNYIPLLLVLLERFQASQLIKDDIGSVETLSISHSVAFYWSHTEVKSTITPINYLSIAGALHTCFCSTYLSSDVRFQSWPHEPGANNSQHRTSTPSYTIWLAELCQQLLCCFSVSLL